MLSVPAPGNGHFLKKITMLDLKSLKGALETLESERGIPKEKILSAIEDALVAAYKKDYGKRGQIIRATLDEQTGKTEFSQIKIAVDDTTVDMTAGDDADGTSETLEPVSETPDGEEIEKLPRYNPEHHILIEDARRIKKDVALGDELVFPLETQDDFGRIAAQTAKQVIIQRLREAEKVSVLDEYEHKQGEILSGKVQKQERGNIFIDLGRATGFLPREEQIPGEHYRQGERLRAYLANVEETPRGINLRLSRAHPQFVKRLFEIEAPEVANGTVELRAIAREPGSRTKIAVASTDPNIDPVGSCVGQRGARVSTVTNELGGEKIDIIEWSEDPVAFITHALSPAKIAAVRLNEEEKQATIEVPADQFSLAIGKGGQNVRLAAKLTGWKLDITSPEAEAREAAAPAVESDPAAMSDEPVLDGETKTNESESNES